jgi:putative methyltransferase (TIGR04325 family)
MNFFFQSKIFDNLNKYLTKKIFKFLKVFFVETNLKEFPDTNYPLRNIDEDLKSSKEFFSNKNLPYMSYSHLPHLLEMIYQSQDKLVFYDYGGGNLNLYYYLNDKFNKILYYFKDQVAIEERVEKIRKNDGLENLTIGHTNNIPNIDILYFGSSLQYIKKYKEKLSYFFKRSKYILIAQTPFFQNEQLNEIIVMKQINMHPNINYLYLFNFDYFVEFMNKNNYQLVEKNTNRVTKFLNFKNFNKKKYKNIDMYDLLFKLKK